MAPKIDTSAISFFFFLMFPLLLGVWEGLRLVLVLLFVACSLFYEAICCMSFRVSFCSCAFQSF